MPPKPPRPPAFTTYKTFILAQERFSVGDTVSVKAPGGGKGDYVAKIDRIHTDKEGEVLIDGRWYYKPEETIMGRQPWNGIDEVFESDHVDTFHVRCVNSKCKIHTLSEYEKLSAAKETPEVPRLPSYFCRSKYLNKQGKIEGTLPRYCACKQPQKPEDPLVRCDGCRDWFFGNCVGIPAAKAGKLKSWTCPICTPEDAATRKRKGGPLAALHDLVRSGGCCPWADKSKAAAVGGGSQKKRKKKGA
eukprot:m.16382 g.16382  ORF g.16382 m.16382 type:complete len:246 (-) comp8981_c0_seq1:158-895(-)